MLRNGLLEAEITAKVIEHGVSFEATPRTAEVLLEYGASCALLEVVTADIPTATRARWNSKLIKQRCPELVGAPARAVGSPAKAEAESEELEYISGEVIEADSLAEVMCGALHNEFSNRRIRVEAEFVQLGMGTNDAASPNRYDTDLVYFQVLPPGYFARGGAAFSNQTVYLMMADPSTSEPLFELRHGDPIQVSGYLVKKTMKAVGAASFGWAQDPEWILFRAEEISVP